MKLLALWLASMAVALTAHAAQIVPMSIATPGGFGPGRPAPAGCTVIFEQYNGQAIQCMVQVPPGAVEIAGWAGYMLDLAPFIGGDAVGYMSTEVWHDGGTPHLLDQPHWGTGVWTLLPVFYPSGDGHACKAGDKFYTQFWCVGIYGHQPPYCAALLLGHFRLAPALRQIEEMSEHAPCTICPR